MVRVKRRFWIRPKRLRLKSGQIFGAELAFRCRFQPISEQLSFGGQTTAATTCGGYLGSGSTMPFVLPVTPYGDQTAATGCGGASTGKKSPEPEAPIAAGALEMAVRRLSLESASATALVRKAPNADDTDENIERTGFGLRFVLARVTLAFGYVMPEKKRLCSGNFRMNVTSCLNPWNPNLISQLLIRLPKKLETFTNFHFFCEFMPAVKVGRTLEVGGEKSKVVKMLGEGAFARAYCVTSLEDETNWVVKVRQIYERTTDYCI